MTIKKTTAKKKTIKRLSKKIIGFKPMRDNAPSVSVYMLLDRSGSMSGRWSEAISSINAYAADLGKQRIKAKITLAAFDAQNGLQFNVLRGGVSAKSWVKVDPNELHPRGGTPLYDAFGRIVNIAFSENPKRAVIVVMTDGAENSSLHYRKETAASLVKECQDRDWQVVFLGADFDAFAQAGAMNLSRETVLNTTQGNYWAASAALSGATTSYGLTGQGIEWSQEARDKAQGKT